MADKHGDFVWYELMTTDAAAAESFYGPIVGWSFDGDRDYRHIKAGDGDYIGGGLPLSEEMTQGGARPAWLGYVAVDDVDATLSAVEKADGRCLMPARDMDKVGRLALVADAQGAPFYVIDPQPPADRGETESTAFAKYEPRDGHCAWNELATSDPEAAKGFYAGLFGWAKDGEMDMGEMGAYEFLRQGDYMIGAVMPKMPQMPVSAWCFYFRVPDIDAAATAIGERGGNVIQEPIEIPGGDYSLVAADPQGAVFGLVGPRKKG